MHSDKTASKTETVTDKEHESCARRYPPLVRMTEQERALIVRGLLDRTIFTIQHIPNEQAELAVSVFLPIKLGALWEATEEYKAQIGTIYEYMSAASPTQIDGYPVFMSFRIIHKDDWIEILRSYTAELDRRDRETLESIGGGSIPS